MKKPNTTSGQRIDIQQLPGWLRPRNHDADALVIGAYPVIHAALLLVPSGIIGAVVGYSSDSTAAGVALAVTGPVFGLVTGIFRVALAMGLPSAKTIAAAIVLVLLTSVQFALLGIVVLAAHEHGGWALLALLIAAAAGNGTIALTRRVVKWGTAGEGVNPVAVTEMEAEETRILEADEKRRGVQEMFTK